MAPDTKKIISFHFILILTAVLMNTPKLKAQEPDFVLNKHSKQLVLAIGVGYGVSNNPSNRVDEDERLLTGPVLNASLGYKISPKFKVDFGPSVWIEGKDVFKSGSNSARPSNKRMIITFNGYYYPFKNNPLNFKLGAGIGNLLYSPEKSRVAADNKTYEDSEFWSGIAGNFAVIYSIRLSQSLKIHPSVNLWYTELSKQEVTYKSYIDNSKASVTADFRASFLFDF